MNTQKKAFTLMELVVVVSILLILSTIGFVGMNGYVGGARDSQRKSDFAKIQGALKLQKQSYGVYPNPGSYITLSNGAVAVALQGRLNSGVTLNTLDSLPLDPYVKLPYWYSITKSGNEFQIAGTLENSDNPKTLLIGDYKTVAVNVLPTIMLGVTASSDVTTAKTKFIFDGSSHNFPYVFDGLNTPVTDGTTLANLLLEAQTNNFWQNSNYRSCAEIKDDGKSIGDGIYQILNNSGTLADIGCTGM